MKKSEKIIPIISILITIGLIIFYLSNDNKIVKQMKELDFNFIPTKNVEL